MKKPLSLYTCSLCKLDFAFDRIKYSPDGKRIVCIPCYSKMLKNKQDMEIQAEASFTRKVPQSDSIDVLCTHCNYRFYYRKSLKPLCPYCGKSSLKRYEEMNAQNIINDAENMR